MLNPAYQVTANFVSAPKFQQSFTTLRLPITTPPSQTLKIVSTGIIESPYQPATDYSSTGLRTRYLWIEFDAPLTCTTWRNAAGVSATAPFATTVLNGQPAIDLRRGDP